MFLQFQTTTITLFFQDPISAIPREGESRSPSLTKDVGLSGVLFVGFLLERGDRVFATSYKSQGLKNN